MAIPLNRIIIYTRHMDAMVSFYVENFGFDVFRCRGDRIVELQNAAGGVILMLHLAGKGQKQGQSTVKLVFDVQHVEDFSDACRKNGLDFGPLHKADGYVFANAKDPSGNSISISSRSFRDS